MARDTPARHCSFLRTPYLESQARLEARASTAILRTTLEWKLSMRNEYEFVPGALASGELVQELATFYPKHYGVWSASSRHL